MKADSPPPPSSLLGRRRPEKAGLNGANSRLFSEICETIFVGEIKKTILMSAKMKNTFNYQMYFLVEH